MAYEFPLQRQALPVPIDADIRAEADREMLLVVLRAGRLTPIAGGFTLLLIALVLGYDSRSDQIALTTLEWAWLCVMQLMLCINSACSAIAVRNGLTAANSRSVVTGYLCRGFVTALCWSAPLWLFLPRLEPLAGGALIAAIAMVLCSGTAASASDPTQGRFFAYPLVVMASAALWRQGDVPSYALALGFPVMAWHMTVRTRGLSNVASERLQLAFLNERLTNKANEARLAAEQARVEAEELRGQAERAREDAVRAAVAKTNFIAATGHDLRQPLHALVQYVADLKATLPGAEDAGKVAKIDQAVWVLSQLLDSMLDFSRVAAGDLRPRLRPLHVPTLLASIESQTLPAARAKGLRFSVRACEGYVFSDEALLLRIIGNVALNAVRYTDSGAIVVRSRRVTGGYRVLVADSGMGHFSKPPS